MDHTLIDRSRRHPSRDGIWRGLQSKGCREKAPRFRRGIGLLRAGLAVAILIVGADRAAAAVITWSGANANWDDGGGTSNWTPADEPDFDDDVVFNTANAVNLGTSNSILTLTMSGMIDLNTNDQDLIINGLVQIAGASTTLFIGGMGSLVAADDMTINAGGRVDLSDGTLRLEDETGSSLFTINGGGTLEGYGEVELLDTLGAVTTLLFNEGTIRAKHNSTIIFGDPLVDTLSITASSANARINLDGTGETGDVTVSRNQTLDINVPPSDAFSGSMNLFQNATFDLSAAWTLDTGTITADNGFFDAPFPSPDVPAGTSTIAGGMLTQTGGSIIVLDPDGVLQFNAPFMMNGGILTNNGHVVFNNATTVANAALFTMGLNSSDLTVGPNAAVTINQLSFNLDGSAAGTEVTVNAGGQLSLVLGDYDNDAVVNAFDATVTLNSGQLSLLSDDAETVMDGTLNMNFTNAGIPLWAGEPLDVGNDLGALDADLNISGAGTSQISSQLDFNSDADVNVAAGAQFHILGTVNFDTVNGANHAEFTGTGGLSFSGPVNVNEAVTLNMAGGTVDLDGVDGFGDVLNVDAPLIIHAATLAAFGRLNGIGINTLEVDNLNAARNGTFTVMLDDTAGEWTLNPEGALILLNDNTEATLLTGNDLNVLGTVNITGDVRTTARLDIASTGTVNIGTAVQPLRLAGGNNVINDPSSDPNTIAGGMINGPGLLGADTTAMLLGFGTINAGIDFDGNADLHADNGTLTLNGAIVDVHTIGTADVDGILEVVPAWNSAVAESVVLMGGTLRGGTMTIGNAAGLTGFGRVIAPVINNALIHATTSGQTLVVDTAGNDNDWDGSLNNGHLKASSSGTLELRDNATFGFTGTVDAASGGRVFTNGFGLDFNPGSTLSLTNGTYQATVTTNIGGTVTIGSGDPSTIEVEVNFFLDFEPTSVTTLNGDLRVVGNNIGFDAGATFSGTGSLIIPAGSYAVADANANLNVLLHNRGTLRPGGFSTPGRVDLKDYQQAATGHLLVEVTGNALNQFDRLVINGSAVLDGLLEIDVDNGFVPSPGQTFDIITTTGTVSGKFFGITTLDMPPGMVFEVTYGPNFVRLTVSAGTHYDAWILKFPSLNNPADRLRTADPDFDGLNNLTEFGMNDDPTKGMGATKLFGKVTSVGGQTVYTLTFPIRYLSIEWPPVQPPGKLILMEIDDEMDYHIQASDSLDAYTLEVTEITGAEAMALHSTLTLPAVDPGWTYRSFRTPGLAGADARRLMRVTVTE